MSIDKEKELKGLIEVDGQQHYKEVDFSNLEEYDNEKYKNYHNLEYQKIRDEIKNNYCIKNKIPLLRLKWYYFQTELYKSKLQEWLMGISLL